MNATLEIAVEAPLVALLPVLSVLAFQHRRGALPTSWVPAYCDPTYHQGFLATGAVLQLVAPAQEGAWDVLWGLEIAVRALEMDAASPMTREAALVSFYCL